MRRKTFRFYKRIMDFFLVSFLILIIVKCCQSFHNEFYSNLQNFTDYREKIRNKRALIFEGGGVNKMLFSGVYPTALEDPVKWRQLNCAYNLQAQYSVPTSPLYWWNRHTARTLQEARENFDRTGHYQSDESRLFVYVALETYMNNNGKNGRKCLMRSICENAQIDEPHGIFAEILYTILTPGKEELHDDYRDAYSAGKNGVECLQLYPECPKGESLIDLIVVDIENS